MFLQLSSRDATTYVYKKTIYEISTEFKKNSDQVSEKTKVKLDIVNSYMEINKTIILKLINNEFTNVEKQNTAEKILKNINNINHNSNNTNHNSNNTNHTNHNSNIKKLNNIIETLYFKTINDTYFFEVCEMLLKKISKNEEYLTKCCNKLLCDDFNDKIKETSGIFITWFMN